MSQSSPTRLEVWGDAAAREWTCAQTGLCCRQTWDIPMTQAAWASIQRACARCGHAAARAHPRVLEDGLLDMPRGSQGACVFLLNEGRCGLRLDVDADALPSTCSDYPFLAQVRPDRVAVGLDLTCPTAAGLALARPLELGPLGPERAASCRELADDYRNDKVVYGLAARRVSASAFWARVHEAVEHARLAVSDAMSIVEPLLTGERSTVEPCRPIEAERLSLPTPPDSTARWARAHGISESALAAWWRPTTHRTTSTESVAGSLPRALALYTQQRLWMPIFLGVLATGHRVVAPIAALRARVALSVARGMTPLDAVREAERHMLADGAITRIFTMADVFPSAGPWTALEHAVSSAVQDA